MSTAISFDSPSFKTTNCNRNNGILRSSTPRCCLDEEEETIDIVHCTRSIDVGFKSNCSNEGLSVSIIDLSPVY
jgi:hypothetical protein